jgi:hypothetical protein
MSRVALAVWCCAAGFAAYGYLGIVRPGEATVRQTLAMASDAYADAVRTERLTAARGAVHALERQAVQNLRGYELTAAVTRPEADVIEQLRRSTARAAIRMTELRIDVEDTDGRDAPLERWAHLGIGVRGDFVRVTTWLRSIGEGPVLLGVDELHVRRAHDGTLDVAMTASAYRAASAARRPVATETNDATSR